MDVSMDVDISDPVPDAAVITSTCTKRIGPKLRRSSGAEQYRHAFWKWWLDGQQNEDADYHLVGGCSCFACVNLTSANKKEWKERLTFSPVSSSILYVIAQRRQWNIREAVSKSARRVMDAIKSLFTRSPQAITPQRRRSSRGMTKLKSPRTAEMLENQQRPPPQPDRFEEAHKMPWEWGGHPHHDNENFDIERGIELASTGNMKITVSTTVDSSNSRSDSSSKTGWGGVFTLGRHK
jgi:hypothetical protein